MIVLGVSLLCTMGCPLVPPSDGADTTTPAPCTADGDCPDGITCIFPDGGGDTGYCDTDETHVTTGVPAPCHADDDCPEGISCVLPDGADGAGFCNVQERHEPEGTPPA